MRRFGGALQRERSLQHNKGTCLMPSLFMVLVLRQPPPPSTLRRYLKVVQQYFGVLESVVLLQPEHPPVQKSKAAETAGPSTSNGHQAIRLQPTRLENLTHPALAEERRSEKTEDLTEAGRGLSSPQHCQLLILLSGPRTRMSLQPHGVSGGGTVTL